MNFNDPDCSLSPCQYFLVWTLRSKNDSIIIYIPILCFIWQQLPCLNVDIHNNDIFSLVRTTKWAAVQIVITSHLGWYKLPVISELIAPRTCYQSAKLFSPFTCLLSEPKNSFPESSTHLVYAYLAVALHVISWQQKWFVMWRIQFVIYLYCSH